MIKVSEVAANRIKDLKKEENHASETFLRVHVKRGGCSGFSYKMDFDSEMKEGDKSFTDNEVQIVVDSQSLLYILGMTLDYEGGLNGQGFLFSNPNATKTCGCGSSFAV